MVDKRDRLWEACCKFVKQHEVRAPESCYQMDNVVIAAPELVEEVANIVGYFDDDSGELRSDD